ncbi:PaaI family thioesterase [Oceanobacillus sp. FSL H7-0719]|uniref:PaaI family thioesterase n=1 Tax=Oceanobacillus sp. FSL H7-0719 TaxID=2954507 RepID=UPI0032502D44
MVKAFKPSDFMNIVNNGAAPPNCDRTMQTKPLYAENGIAKGIWNVDEKYLNGNGVSMGGFLASAADIMMAYAITSQLKENQTFASIDLQTTFHRPVSIGTVEVVAKVERLGKKVAYLEAELTQHDKAVGKAVSSIMIIENDR